MIVSGMGLRFAVALAALLVAPAAFAQPALPTGLSYNFRTGVITFQHSGCGGNVFFEYRYATSGNWTDDNPTPGPQSPYTHNNIAGQDYVEVRAGRWPDTGCSGTARTTATTYTAVTVASSPASLDDSSLDGAELTVTLGGDHAFGSGVSAASFQLVANPSVSGLSVSSITGGDSGTRTATLTLGFTGNITGNFDLKVRVLAAAHNGSTNLTSFTGLSVTPDYDDDDDGLIEITTLAQLNAVRWDLNGDGSVAAGNATNYAAAFPNAPADMGCPATGCAGYELDADLDFDTDGDGDVDSSDSYSNWSPIGTLATTFEGNGHTITRLRVQSTAEAGLFSQLSSAGRISGVGLLDAQVTSNGNVNVGTLLGFNSGGTVIGCYAVGGSVSNTHTANAGRIGGLVGRLNRGAIRASHSSATVTLSNRSTGGAGGLVGTFDEGTIVASYATGAVSGTTSHSYGRVAVGGLIGATTTSFATLTYSYSTGAVNHTGSNGRVGGLIGYRSASNNTITNSYWDRQTSGRTGSSGGTSRSTSDLQTPTSATGIFSTWTNVDVNGNGTADEDPWDFGTNAQYPVLKVYGHDPASQRHGVTVNPTTLTVAEGASATYTIRLNTLPSATVTVTVTSADTDAVTADTDTGTSGNQSTLSFTTANWAAPQTVTLTAEQDDNGVDETVTVTNTASTASMSEYTGLSATLEAKTVDDETPGLVFDADPSTSGTDEAGPLRLQELASGTRTDDYSVRLAAQPTVTVMVTITSADDGAVLALDTDSIAQGSQNTLTFTTTNWNAPQIVWLASVQDDDGVDESVAIRHAASTASSSEYTGVTGYFAASVDDDETPALALSATTRTVVEQSSATYTVALAAQPKAGDVTVSITGAASGISANPTSLTFTATNWNTARTVTLRAADDTNTANEMVTLTHTASHAGGEYDGLVAEIDVTASDDDQPGLRVDPTALTVLEEAVETYRVRLNTSPSAAVTVTVGGATAKVGVDTDPDTTGDQTTLTFDATNWSAWQTVRVRGIDDGDGADEAASLTHAVTGPADYTGLVAGARPGVSVTVDDRDVATVELSPASLTLFEGGGATAEGMWTVRLANLAPTGPVSVTVTSSDPAVVLTGAPVTLNFTTANWDTAQTVTARAVDDDNATSERVEVRHAASGANYGGVEAVLRVGVTDDEAPPDAPAGLAATPGDGRAVLSWSNPQNPSITRYERRYAEAGASLGAWRAVSGAGPDTTSLTVAGLANGRAYVFEVRAGNPTGDGAVARTTARLAAAPGQTVNLPDTALAAAVRAAVGKSAGQPLTAGDLATVLSLDLSRPAPAEGRWRAPQTGGAAVEDLRGIEALVNLRRLNLDNNEVADLSPLLALAYLDWLSVRGNPLSSDSVFLYAVALRERGVEVLLDPATVVSLPDLGLRRAVEVALGKSPGAALTAGDLLTLTSLSAESAGVASLSGLEAASRLESLTLSGNAPPAGAPALDIRALSALRSLSYLDLSDNGLADLSALGGLTSLRTLLLGGNAVRDLSPLAGLTELAELTLSGNGLANVSTLSGLSALRQLWLDGNALESVKPLGGLASLVYLHLGDNRISDIGPLGWLSDLRRLWLPGNRVADVSALSGLRRLTRLDLSRNRVANIAPLAGLPELSLLRLGWNQVADVAPLAGHEGLVAGGALGLRGNPLGAEALERQVPALREAGAAVVVGWAVPLFPAASALSGRGGFVRVLNRSESAGEVLVEAVDEAGRRSGPVRLALGPRQAAHFNSADLESGNARKGLPEGVGAPTRGSWRLVVSSALDIEVLSYLRGPGGFVAAAHGALRRDGERLSAFVFHPGRDRTQRSALRILNPGASVVHMSAWGVDDAGRGRLATGFAAPAGGALAVTARELESSRRSGPGLGKGEGKWRLAVSAPWPVEALSLLESPGGHLSNLSSAPVRAGADGVLRLPLFPSASDDSGRQGFARVANLTAHDGWAEVSAVDGAGVRAGPARLLLPARATIHFDAAELEAGNLAKGLSPGLGAPTRGSWRLELRSGLDLRAGAYARHADGFLTSLREAAPSAAGVARVAVFNPASNTRQRSLLRLVNNGEETARATIAGMDDAGAEAGPVSLTVPAGEALTLTSVQLEEGGEGPAPSMEVEGALGNGEGKWRLTVTFDRPLVVMSLMESPTGHLTNLSATARP